MAQTIDVASGAEEYTWFTVITEVTGKDIASDSVRISLGTDDEPGPWLTPDIIQSPVANVLRVQVLIGVNAYYPGPGQYRVWVYLVDNPEEVPRKGAKVTLT